MRPDAIVSPFRTVAAAALVLAAAAGFAPAARADHCPQLPDPDLKLGFNGQAFFIENAAEGIPDYTQRFLTEYEELGALSIRLGIDWQVIEPEMGDRFFSGENVGWNYTDMVEAFHAAGVEVQGLFNTAPAWVTETEEDDDDPNYGWASETPLEASDENLEALREIVRDTLVYFYENGCVERWEFWNEPHRGVPPSADSAGSIGHPQNYARWFAAFLDGVALAEDELRAGGHDIDFEIALGGVDGDDIGSWTTDVLQQAAMVGRIGEADALAFHPYDRAGQQPTGVNPQVFDPGVAAAQANGWEVWITEFGYNSESGDLQRDKLCYALSWLANQPVGHANLHLLHDIHEGSGCTEGDDPNCFGLINNDFVESDPDAYDPAEDRKQPVYDQFRRLAELLQDPTIQLQADGSTCAPSAPELLFPDSEQAELPADGVLELAWGPSDDPLSNAEPLYQSTLFVCDGDNCFTPIRATAEEAGLLADEVELQCDTRYRWVVRSRSAEFGVPSRDSERFFTTSCERLQSGPMDLCFAIDTTGSMGPYIDPAKVAATAIVGSVFEVSTSPRVAVTDFRDYPFAPWGAAGDYPFFIRNDFSNDQASIVGGIQSLNLGNGSDIAESVYAGLIGCILGAPGFEYTGPTLSPWRAEAVKAIILMGDAPPHEPEPVSAYDQAGVIEEANEGGITTALGSLGDGSRSVSTSLPVVDPAECEPGGGYAGIRVFGIHVGSDPSASAAYQALAEGTCGSYINVIDPAEVVDAILDVIGEVASLPNNQPPDVSGAFASPDELWPPDHRFTDIEIQGVTDPEGEAVSLTVTAITQDEPVRGPGRRHSPDGRGVGTATAQVRAERFGHGNGRVYEISFTATDAAGLSTDGTVQVCVPRGRRHHPHGPHHHRRHHPHRPGGCVDDGQAFDSTRR